MMNISDNRFKCPASILLFALCLLIGCSGISSSNVGTPSGQDIREFDAALASLHIGMPADSIPILFKLAQLKGDVGILHTTRIVTADMTRITYTLGWKFDPSHQTGYKTLEDIDEEDAAVVTENGRVVEITLFD
ncbi:MAG: hypothetical protein GY835_08270 [bacterium]|nr:hypothetical protein [bacterium]